GALAMNAGTADGWIGDFVSAVYYLHPDGTLGEFKPGSGTFTYRAFNAPAGAVLIGWRARPPGRLHAGLWCFHARAFHRARGRGADRLSPAPAPQADGRDPEGNEAA